MGGLEKYYDRDSLAESIRFNAHFLELASLSMYATEEWQLSPYAELQHLISEWKRRDYPSTNLTDWADEILVQYSSNLTPEYA